MVFPDYTITGRKWKKECFEDDLKVLKGEKKHDPLVEKPTQLDLIQSLYEYILTLEYRIEALESEAESRE